MYSNFFCFRFVIPCKMKFILWQHLFRNVGLGFWAYPFLMERCTEKSRDMSLLMPKSDVLKEPDPDSFKLKAVIIFFMISSICSLSFTQLVKSLNLQVCKIENLKLPWLIKWLFNWLIRSHLPRSPHWKRCPCGQGSTCLTTRCHRFATWRITQSVINWELLYCSQPVELPIWSWCY